VKSAECAAVVEKIGDDAEAAQLFAVARADDTDSSGDLGERSGHSLDQCQTAEAKPRLVSPHA
jgi:hypothetical protein